MTVTTNPADARTLTDDLAALLLLFGGDVDGAVVCEARAGVGCWRLQVGPEYRSPLRRGLLPAGVLEPLEHDEAVFTVSPAIRATGNDRYVLATTVAFVRWRLEPAFIGGVWRIPTEPRANVFAAIEGFACPPSVVIDAGTEIVAVWRLARPFDLVLESGYLAAMRLQRHLAERLGGTTAALPHVVHSGSGKNSLEHIPGHDPVGFLPVTGTQQDLGMVGARPLIRVCELEPSRVYTAEQLDGAATAAATTPAAVPSDRSKRAATAAKE